MILPQRIEKLLERSFAYLHPCLYGSVGGGSERDLQEIADALEKEVECLMGGAGAGSAVAAFVSRLPEVRRLIDTDVQAAYEGDPAATSRMEVVMAYPGLYAVTVHRLAHELYKLKVPVIPRVMSELAHSRTGIDIHPGAVIGERFFIDHGTGVVIGETTVIGNNVKIYQGVTLGALSFPKDEKTGMLRKGHKRHPNVEDNVVIYAGATILGGDTVIGHDSEIGGNVWLMESIPPNSRVYNKPPAPEIRGKKTT
jgi:serine O-acetyltransferase